MNDGALQNLSTAKNGRRRRQSSFDRTGGNADFVVLDPQECFEAAAVEVSGAITHIWVTLASMEQPEEPYLPRKVVLRMYWDGEDTPSVEAPIGDFFGLGHGVTKNFSSAALTMSPQDGRAWNCYFPMPFSHGARVTVENQAEGPVRLYYYVDYDERPVKNDELRFHAQWRQERLTDGIDDSGLSNEYFEFGGRNTTGLGNYVLLEAKGRGHYVGCNLNIHNQRMTDQWNWYGEGDDMIFIDGESWPPSLHGTGMEDYFNTAWCPQQEICTPYHGIILGGKDNWAGKICFYRYHILDPIMFEQSIKVTIEHGHNNHRSDDYSSTAYWYQTEPHAPFPALAPVEERLPLPDIRPLDRERAAALFEDAEGDR